MNCTECDCSNGYHADGCPVRTGQPTLRQRYAMAALTGLLSAPRVPGRATDMEQYIGLSWRYADAMLAATDERERG